MSNTITAQCHECDGQRQFDVIELQPGKDGSPLYAIRCQECGTDRVVTIKQFQETRSAS